MSDIKINDKQAVEIPTQEKPAARRAQRKPARPAKAIPNSPPLFDTVESAAVKLGLDPTALRARLRRAQRVEGNAVVADLGGGIRGFKFGKSWRIRFPEA